MTIGLNWTCPFCNRPQTVTNKQYDKGAYFIDNDESTFGDICFEITTYRCANPECTKLTLYVLLAKKTIHGGNYVVADPIRGWNLLPESSAKPLPDYIPQSIAEDYREACRIRDLSPKASATLARRCLQGMIRDFCKITRDRLIDEIRELRRQMDEGEAQRHVSADTVDAIDHVRKLGNIGAHMDKDINLIIDIDPGEAQQLIGLIELLFDEWYVQTEERRLRLVAIGALAAEKAEAKRAGKTPEPKDG